MCLPKKEVSCQFKYSQKHQSWCKPLTIFYWIWKNYWKTLLCKKRLRGFLTDRTLCVQVSALVSVAWTGEQTTPGICAEWDMFIIVPNRTFEMINISVGKCMYVNDLALFYSTKSTMTIKHKMQGRKHHRYPGGKHQKHWLFVLSNKDNVCPLLPIMKKTSEYNDKCSDIIQNISLFYRYDIQQTFNLGKFM